ncbi:acyltransferase family protein [Kocuria rhizophila]|uniref:acyltransferase family protein n=1 Tax=Kocuria rhizophila TaxID=72000 RepID=UPI00174A0B1A|nr:acyltransferase [Kocuria rhizophila]MCT1456855.1 acyltransferase [Kocuria rhizophila]MCT1879960.1 acyltransferase [Kocuria rhizophila]MCT2249837.1 acyltransferase [Kocuria rhizophila]
MTARPPGGSTRFDRSTEGRQRATLGSRLSSHANALNAIRLLLAAAVILGHTVPVGGYPQSAWQNASGAAVNGFFAISGYLIAGSRMRLSLRGFLWRRALRLYPAFWVSLAVTAAVIAPVSALLSGETVVPGSALAYVVANATLYITQWDIQHLLTSVPYPDVWNASLWTLWYEAAAYIAAGLLLTLPWARRRPLTWISLAFVLVALLQFATFDPVDLSATKLFQGFRLGGFFLAGMLLWAARNRVPLRWWLAVPSLLLTCMSPSWPEPFNWFAVALPFAYGLLWLGAALPVRLGSVNDLSYGTYIYAFPVQQLLAVAGAHTVLGYWGFATVALLVTLVFAWLSWHLVEKPTLRLKSAVS